MPQKKLLENYFPEMIETLQKVLSFNSEKADALPNAPFGQPISDCLNFVLETAQNLGFSVFNCDGYAGHVDFEGEEGGVVGVLGHLDIVPAKESDGWICSPFSGKIIDGKLYGRGTMDDKGPMIACLFALKALKDSGFKPAKTIRLVFGCDEESGMSCMDYYFKKVAPPDISFSPDGDFPVINREKGIMQFEIDFGEIDQNILEISAGSRTNVVASACQVSFKNSDGKIETFTTHGKSAHASLPDSGKNATWEAFKRLAQAFPNDEKINYIATKMCDFSGKLWGLNLSDEESGNLTCNIGVVKTVPNEKNRLHLKISVDIRFPVTFSLLDIHNKLREILPYPYEIEHAKEPLYVPSDSFLVSTLTSVFNDVTNQSLEPIAIGGGTYSRCLKNCVAFGPLFPNEVQTIHMPNENIDLENLKLMTEIFFEAMRRLAEGSRP